jgi:hypothetical protein
VTAGQLPSQPRARLGDERPERSLAFDAPDYRVVQLGLAGERLDQRIGLPGQQTVEVRHRHELVEPLPFFDFRERRRREQLGYERHSASVPHPARRRT